MSPPTHDADTRIPVAISIAGSDSGGGAGIQADLKAFARSGVHGTTAITAITAQSTVGVRSVHQIPPGTIRDQVAAVAEDIGIDAVKIGMLGTTETTAAVAEALRESGLAGTVPIVIDPVMVAESGAVLLDPDAKSALIESLLPLATVATPNLLEARELGGDAAGADPAEPPAEADRVALARAILDLGPRAVVITGGHTPDGADLLLERGANPVSISGPRHPDGASHGSGCTHSSALAAHLALGFGIEDAARRAREITAEAVAAGHRRLGSGTGPVNALGVAARGVGHNPSS
jgi:hydroxymethylpyrimidine/phosphomethylpyrimidine kinase